MMSMSVYFMVATIGVFWVGTAVALAWSVAAGQWHDTAQGARIVLDEEG